MTETPSSKGKGAPSLLYCHPTDDKGAGRRSLTPPTGSPNPTHKGEQSRENRPVPPIPSAGGADNRSENAKKRRLNSHSKCLQAAGVAVKFAEDR